MTGGRGAGAGAAERRGAPAGAERHRGAPDRSPAPAPAPAPALLIDWPLNTATGWGVFGLNLALQLLRQQRCRPALLMRPDLEQASPVARALLHHAVLEQAGLARVLDQAGDATLDGDLPVLRGLGRDFQPHGASARIRAPHNVGITFFEDTALSAEALQWAGAYDLLFAGSRWNVELLRARGIGGAQLLHQGVDPSVFLPGPASGLLARRFVIFSGGKLEYRKGQDLVIAAFRRFVRRHPEALLLTAWHNPWPRTVTGIDLAGHVTGLPDTDADGALALAPWLVANGLPPGSFVETGPLPNWAMAPLYREADLAVFPNRAEGGTNLVAMEAMASGVPCILAPNTGQADLIREGHGYVLTRQAPVAGGCPLYAGYDGWGESDVEEILALMEQAYQDREEARRRGRRAAEWMREQWSWEVRLAGLVERLEEADVLPGS